jgi:hypothetical protein
MLKLKAKRVGAKMVGPIGCNIDKLFKVLIVNIVMTISHLDKFRFF